MRRPSAYYVLGCSWAVSLGTPLILWQAACWARGEHNAFLAVCWIVIVGVLAPPCAALHLWLLPREAKEALAGFVPPDAVSVGGILALPDGAADGALRPAGSARPRRSGPLEAWTAPRSYYLRHGLMAAFLSEFLFLLVGIGVRAGLSGAMEAALLDAILVNGVLVAAAWVLPGPYLEAVFLRVFPDDGGL